MSLTSDTHACRLYIISPPALDPLIFAPRLAQALDAGDVAAFQLRMPNASAEELQHAADLLIPIAHDRDVAFIVHNRVEVAKKSGADGVHLGPQSVSVREARTLLGEDAIIGAAAIASRHLAMTAAEQGASYVSFGPFFASRSPLYPPEVLDAQTMAPQTLLSWWQETMEIPCVAAGGIKPAHCGELVATGVDFICAATAIWEHPQGAAAAICAFNEEIQKAAA